MLETKAIRIPVAETIRDLSSLYLDPLYRRPVYRLVEGFTITLPDGTTWRGSLWARRDGTSSRRIQVRDRDGTGLYDTDDCHDLGNATFKLRQWLAAQIPDTQPARAA